MKKVNLCLLVLVSSLLMGSSLYAAKSGNELKKISTAENSVRQQLADVLSNVSSNGGLVFVYFNVTPKGFDLLDVKGLDLSLVKDVEGALKYSSINVSAVPEGKYLVKIRFAEKNAPESSFLSANDVLRSTISQALSSLSTRDGGMVTILFQVRGGNLVVKKVEAQNQFLASEVENTLASGAITVPSYLAGNYQLNVHF